MTRKTTPRWLCAITLTAGVILIAAIVALVAVLTASEFSTPKARYADEAAKQGGDGGSEDSMPVNVRTPTSVRPSPSPSAPIGSIWVLLQNLTSAPIATIRPTPTQISSEPAPVPTLIPPAVDPVHEQTTAPIQTKDPPSTTPEQNQGEPLPNEATTTIWYGLGDIPYAPAQAIILENQMKQLALDAEFVIHVGDLRLSGDNLTCKLSEYEDVAARLAYSHAPVFVVMGDNDWNDCPNMDDGLRFWKRTFVGFESKHWNHTFKIERQENREENFSFVHKGTLFMGLNIVGGLRHNLSEWESRLTDQADWTMDLIQRYRTSKGDAAGRIVIFGHANPHYLHNSYFHPLKTFIQQKLNNEIPILYFNGDKHEWSYDEQFYDQPSFLRIMVTAKGTEPPVKMMIDSATASTNPVDAFQYDRMLEE